MAVVRSSLGIIVSEIPCDMAIADLLGTWIVEFSLAEVNQNQPNNGPISVYSKENKRGGNAAMEQKPSLPCGFFRGLFLQLSSRSR